MIGTPGYIPPEQAVGAPLDARGDLYALGCVAWWLLTGDEVYSDVAGDDPIRTHVTEPVPELRPRVDGWLPEALERLIKQCLEKRPQDRPDDARALAAALGEIEIPAEHAWTRAMAITWWKNLRASATSSPDAVTAPAHQPATVASKPAAGASLVVVPQRSSRDAEDGNDARTVEARPSGRIG